MSLEITAEQRVPGLKNPLTQEQVDWVEAKAAKENWPLYLEDPQVAAQAVLPLGATLEGVLEEMFAHG